MGSSRTDGNVTVSGEPRIALINPSVGFTDRRKSKPIGVAYILAYLRAHGFEGTGFDFGNSTAPTADLVARHRLYDYDVLGLSLYNESFASGIEITRLVKKVNPDIFVVMGGPQATATHQEILRAHPEVDGVVRREGELPMLALVRELAREHPDLARVPSLTWSHDGRVEVNAEADPIDDLDALPFPDVPFVSDSGYPPLYYFDERGRSLRPALTVNSSRSCPYNCSFCGVITIGRRYRSRSAESVIAEIAHFRIAHDLLYRHIYFSDANFFVQPGRSLDLIEKLHEFDREITFSFGTRVNQLLRAESVLARMSEIGLRFVEVGIESASPAVLQRLAKGVGPEVNVAAVKMLKRLGIEIALDFIMVDPASTVEDLQANMEFLEQNGFVDYYPQDHLYSYLSLYEGTPIRSFYEQRYDVHFGLGVLPDIGPLFEQPELARFWDISRQFLRQYQTDLDLLLVLLETLQQSPEAHRLLARRANPDRDRLLGLQLDTVTLRHAPSMFIRRLIDGLAAGARPDTCEDVGLRDFGRRREHLRAILGRARADAQEIAQILRIPHRTLEEAMLTSGALVDAADT